MAIAGGVMPVVMMRARLSGALHAVAERCADDDARRAGQSADGGAAGRATGTALMLRPVVAERAGGRNDQCRTEQCCDELIVERCHGWTSLVGNSAKEIPALEGTKWLMVRRMAALGTSTEEEKFELLPRW